MPLNDDRFDFFRQQIKIVQGGNFSGAVAHMFSYLAANAQENPVYLQYENDRKKWKGWPSPYLAVDDWGLPSDFGDAMSLAYALYATCGELGKDCWNLLNGLFDHPQFIGDRLRLFRDSFEAYFMQALDHIVAADPGIRVKPDRQVSDRVFVVHGHDTEMKESVARFVERLGLKAVVLHEQPDAGSTVIEKYELHSDVDYAIVLMSPDDLGSVASGREDPRPRARQNVIFELGYFVGKLGRGRVSLLRRGNVEMPTDFQGVLYTDYDAAGAWRIKVATNMKAAGMKIDMNRLS